MYSLQYTGAQLRSGIQSTLALGFLYLLVSGIIGWLKQTIDSLIIKEADARKRLEAILEQLPVGIIIASKNGGLLSANKKIESIVGSKVPRNFIVGKSRFINYLDGDKAIDLSQYPLSRALKGKNVINQELIIKRHDKRLVFVNVSSSPIKNREGNIIAAASIISDITHQKELERRKDDFVNMASHELKTPLTSMILYLSSLNRRVKGNSDKTLLNTIKRIQNQTENLRELVDDLLDVSRLDTGKLRYNHEKFEINKLVNEVIVSLQETTSQKIVFSKNKSTEITGDKFRITQVLTNLISNAIKYSSQEGKINIKSKKKGNEVVISVKDSGIGIDKSEQLRIFDRLYQITDDEEKTFPGLGMGLYISKEIINNHGGRIWVESEKGKGSTFFFTLPVK